jgi:hypothetical protein
MKITAAQARQKVQQAAYPLEKVYDQIKALAESGHRQCTFVSLSKDTVESLIEDGFSVSYDRPAYMPTKEWIIRW